MTLIVNATGYAGLAVSADSRSCITLPDRNDDGSVRQVYRPGVASIPVLVTAPFSDQERKLAIVNERFVIGWAGQAPQGSPSTAAALDALCGTKGIARCETANELLPALVSYGRDRLDAILSVAWVDPGDHAAHVAAVRWPDGVVHHASTNQETGEQHAGLFPVGYDDVVQRLFRVDSIPFVQLSLQQLLDLSRLAVRVTADIHELEARPVKAVGGPILSAIIDRTGHARWAHPLPEPVAREFGSAKAA